MRLTSFTKTGLWRGKHSYTFKRSRIKSPTECYDIYLEDSDGYILTARTSLATSILEQVDRIVDYAREDGYLVHSVFSESGERYPI
jgi:hypothetical protein